MLPTNIRAALYYEATVIRAQSQDLKSLSKSRKEHLERSAQRLESLAAGEFPYQRVSYGIGLRAV